MDGFSLNKHFTGRLFLALTFLLPVFIAAAQGTGSQSVLCPSFTRDDRGQLRASYISDLPEKLVFYKIDQGFSYGRLLDQRMSNLHYSGPGGTLSFGRHVRTDQVISQWQFAGFRYQNSKPAHGSTQVEHLVAEVNYGRLKPLYSGGPFRLWIGGLANVSANIRTVPRLSNSYLYADLSANIRPWFQAGYSPYFFGRPWHFDFDLSAALAGYAFRSPIYGTTFNVSRQGGSTIEGHETQWLHPGNFRQVETGVFWKESFGGAYNHNWFRLGYYWRFQHLKGSQGHDFYDVSHGLSLQLYFLVN